MSRQARVRLRPLTRSERATLKAKIRKGSLPARLHRRYRAIALVRDGCSIVEAARRSGWNNQNVYHWVHRFNEDGFASFERPSNPRGRLPLISARQLRELCNTALTRPETLGLPFTTWTVRTLNEYCQRRRLIPAFSDEWVRLLLRRSGLSAQRIRTWKTSDDPRFAKKATHPLPLRAPPAARGGRQLRRVGPARVPADRRTVLGAPGEPARMRATYTRKKGIECFFGFYDVHADVLGGVFRTRKRIAEVGEAFRRLRTCYPHRRLYVIIDGLHQVHDHPRFLALCRRLRITLVFTPTECSWMNPIEPHFGVLGRATYAGSDDPEHEVRRRRVYRYLRLRHRKLGNAAHPLTRILWRRRSGIGQLIRVGS